MSPTCSSPPFQIFHFCSILILLSALMFESGANIEKKPLVCFKSAPVAGNATDAKAEEEKIAASQYLLVVFVITIVVVSSLYFLIALMGELSRSCSHFLKVNRSRKKDKKNDKTKVVDAWQKAKARRSSNRFPSESKDDNFNHSVNPLHSPSDRSASQASVDRMRRFSTGGSISSDNPLRSSSGTRRSLHHKEGKSTDSPENKSSENLAACKPKPRLSQFRAGGVTNLVQRMSVDI